MINVELALIYYRLENQNRGSSYRTYCTTPFKRSYPDEIVDKAIGPESSEETPERRDRKHIVLGL